MISPARAAAFEVLRRVFEEGAWADRALPAAIERHGVSGRERGLAQRLAYGAVQRRGSSDFLIGTLARRAPGKLDDPVLAALRLGLFELLFSETADHAAVDQAVELAKASPRGRRGAGLVNAVLRRAAREGRGILDGLAESDPGSAAARHSYPRWLAELWWEELGAETALALMAAQNRPAETALRANELRAGRDELLAELRAGGVEAEPAPGPAPLDVRESIVARGALGEAAAAAIEAGRAIGQSRSSAAAVALLDPARGERVLDLCAGPGVKTTMIAARMENEGTIRSVELRPQRAALVAELAARLGATIVEPVVADAGAADDLGEGYDRVLVDPPCSDLGTLASRPDARWRKEPGDPERLAALQGEILARGGAALRPGGTLVYSTCTISARENEAVVATALEAGGGRRGLRADALGELYPELASGRDPRFLQVRPDRDGTDGFFIARLRRDE
ncbi:MAG TPA: transcription antitermination factor NusB [Solirubrobacterales bacterium]